MSDWVVSSSVHGCVEPCRNIALFSCRIGFIVSRFPEVATIRRLKQGFHTGILVGLLNAGCLFFGGGAGLDAVEGWLWLALWAAGG